MGGYIMVVEKCSDSWANTNFSKIYLEKKIRNEKWYIGKQSCSSCRYFEVSDKMFTRGKTLEHNKS